MKKLDRLKAQKIEIQAQIDLLESLPEDLYNLGTVALFSSSTKKWYYVKTEEETWRQMKGGSGHEQSLAEWILQIRTVEPNTDFEVYIMSPALNPIYATV